MNINKQSKTAVLQFCGGALCSLPLNVLMLIFLIASVRLFENSIATRLDTMNPIFIVRLFLFIPPIILSGVMLGIRRKQQNQNKVFFWTGAVIFQILLLLIIRPSFDM